VLYVLGDSVLLLVLDGSVCCCMFYVAMCVVVCFRWQCVLLGFLRGKMSCWVFLVAVCVVGSFTWQFVLYVLGDKLCYCLF